MVASQRRYVGIPRVEMDQRPRSSTAVAALLLFLGDHAVTVASGFIVSTPCPPRFRLRSSSNNNNNGSNHHHDVPVLPSGASKLQKKRHPINRLSSTSKTSISLSSSGDDWNSLTNDGAVRMLALSPGTTGDVPKSGDEVAIEYVGTIADRCWSAQDVVDCWLSEQQGLDALGPKFLELDIDGASLSNEDYFTEAFVSESLGVENRIQCKKLVMAAKRLSKEFLDFPVGTEFDSSKERGVYRFVLGKGKAVKGMDIGVAHMAYGEKARILSRSDYMYGKEGLRKSNGDVMVPPFATLQFDLTLLDK